MAVSEFELTEILPDDLKSNLPSIEEIEEEIKKIEVKVSKIEGMHPLLYLSRSVVSLNAPGTAKKKN
jgi:hypothetical protein